MFARFDIKGVHINFNDDIRRYAEHKLGRLDRYIGRQARASAHTEVFLKEEKIKTKKVSICEVVMYLPKETLTISEATLNIYSSIDIVQARLKNALKKYKEIHGNPRLHRRLLARIKGRM